MFLNTIHARKLALRSIRARRLHAPDAGQDDHLFLRLHDDLILGGEQLEHEAAVLVLLLPHLARSVSICFLLREMTIGEDERTSGLGYFMASQICQKSSLNSFRFGSDLSVRYTTLLVRTPRSSITTGQGEDEDNDDEVEEALTLLHQAGLTKRRAIRPCRSTSWTGCHQLRKRKRQGIVSIMKV